MKKIFLISSLITTLLSCDFGPKAALSEEFEDYDRSKELPFSNLIGKYELDDDSKKRYNINDSVVLKIKIEDSLIYCNQYISIKNRSIIKKDILRKIYYINDYKEKNPSLFIGIRNNKSDDFYSNIDIYYRKKDRTIALYIYTPFVEATEENNMKYIEGDYLRYIKVKDSIK